MRRASSFVLLRRRPQRLRQHRQVVRLDGRLLRPRPEERPADADEVAEVDLLEHGKGVVADLALLEVGLDPSAAVAQIDERRLAHVAHRRHPPGDGRLGPRAVFGRERGRFRRRVRWREAVWIGVDPARTQAFQFFLAQRDQIFFSHVCSKRLAGPLRGPA